MTVMLDRFGSKRFNRNRGKTTATIIASHHFRCRGFTAVVRGEGAWGGHPPIVTETAPGHRRISQPVLLAGPGSHGFHCQLTLIGVQATILVGIVFFQQR